MADDNTVTIIGAGLAGCECALQLADRGTSVVLYEMKPIKRTPAQTSDHLAELVCSNSFRSANPANAIGLLKLEMAAAGSHVMDVAYRHAVPAGDALAVDRERFAEEMTARIQNHPGIELRHEVVSKIPQGLTVVSTGPLTDEALAAEIAQRAGRDSLHFYDSIAPIIDSDSVDWSVVWRQSRYDKGEGADYGNVPLTEAQYLQFIDDLLEGDKVRAHAFENATFFEGCLPIEVMAERGPLTLAHGPMKPVGLTDPRTEQRPFAVAQLRMENREGSAWNLVGFQTRLRYPEQKRIFRSLPGLEKAEFLRFGSIHRNTYLHAPSLLHDALHFHDDPNLYFAGQITGVEGYVESTACAMLVSWFIHARLQGHPMPSPPDTTAFGALYRHLRGDGILSAYAPSNLNWGLFTPIERRRGEKKRAKRARMAARARVDFDAWWRPLAG
ncbi:MAG: methylenetetrahydrofolate--tRNA-(uracil(54)-C(5))-methyltransferase (FADH(2)-oxidizing) TrmFO [Myxococcota bacterium]|nr:methylenetetrahydrofolate--tRNA-(uracil(54)-C(5))-methyltransferase (FADH(2)-oxidizing) TrmFO [Myxococcota bacterium]